MSNLHLLRPEWLWAFAPLTVIVILLIRQGSATARWGKVIAPHLLEHLVVRPKRGWAIRPVHLLLVVGMLSTLAMAGPTWQREPSPFTEDTAPMVIALELTPRMLVSDVQPSRLERAKHKIRDIARARAGSRTALIVYAGSAHTVAPLTDDPAAIEAFVMDLEPGLMPVEGHDPSAALRRATQLLDGDGTPGTVVYVTAGLPELVLPALEEFATGRRDQLQVLAVATEAGGLQPGGEFSALDRAALDAAASRSGAVVTLFTVDDSDVERIVRRSQSHLESVQQDEPEGRWRDEGWYLVWPVAAIVLLWFRRGWLIRWEE